MLQLPSCLPSLWITISLLSSKQHICRFLNTFFFFANQISEYWELICISFLQAEGVACCCQHQGSGCHFEPPCYCLVANLINMVMTASSLHHTLMLFLFLHSKMKFSSLHMDQDCISVLPLLCLHWPGTTCSRGKHDRWSDPQGQHDVNLLLYFFLRCTADRMAAACRTTGPERPKSTFGVLHMSATPRLCELLHLLIQNLYRAFNCYWSGLVTRIALQCKGDALPHAEQAWAQNTENQKYQNRILRYMFGS